MFGTAGGLTRGRMVTALGMMSGTSLDGVDGVVAEAPGLVRVTVPVR